MKSKIFDEDTVAALSCCPIFGHLNKWCGECSKCMEMAAIFIEARYEVPFKQKFKLIEKDKVD